MKLRPGYLFRRNPIWGCDILVSRAKVIENQVMAISVVLISSDSSEESVRTSTARVILFGTIPIAILATVPIVDPPVVHDNTPLIPTKTPIIPPVVSTLPHTSPFLHTDSYNSDNSERPPSKDPYEVIVARWRSRPIPVGQPYRTQPSGVRKMLTARKSVGPLPSHRLTLRYSESHSLLDHFSPDDFSSGSSSGYSSDTSSGCYIPDSSFDTPAASCAGPSRKRRRSPTVSVPLATPVPGALSHVRTDILPPRKRIRGYVSATDQDDSTEESYEAYIEPDIDSNVQADINVDTAAAEAAAAREANNGVEVSIGFEREDEVEDEAESSHKGTVEVEVDTVAKLVVSEDTPVPTDDEGSREGHRMLAASQQSVVMSDRIGVLERDNMRLRAMLCIERERINSLRRHMAYTQEELRQIRRFRDYDRMETIPTATRTGINPGAIEEMIERRVAEALEAYRNRKPTRENGDGHEDDNGDDNGNGNGDGGRTGNGNGLGGGNGAGNPNVNVGGVAPVAHECTYQDFMKCQPLNFKGTEGAVGLTRWFKKMEMWNSHKRTVGTDAAYTMTWKVLIKLMTEVYCPQNEIQKMETELWNLTVRNNDWITYTQRFQELVLLCTNMVPEEEDWVEKFIGGLPDNIQGNVIAVEPTL
ncbi:putative reverse transcriptase domain-containing protein [Tanacetum coccineum]